MMALATIPSLTARMCERRLQAAHVERRHEAPAPFVIIAQIKKLIAMAEPSAKAQRLQRNPGVPSFH